ncbi:hypothetical protein, partial [Deinococcus roseus]|uniref:hypothetical protein n=1 Tax=Deinococcus roseus TaxID=392414 RepID=UPI001669B77C
MQDIQHIQGRLQDLDPVLQDTYQVLRRLAAAHAQKHRRKFIGTYCFFTSNELLMDALGLKKTTFYQVLAALQATGLVYRKGWTSPIKNPTTGKAVCGGTLWAIVVDPNSTRKARFTWWDWHGGMYRDMARVLTEKTSVHNFRCKHEQTLQSLEKEMRYQILEGYTLSGVLEINPVTPVGSVCSQDPKELIFALESGKFLLPQTRGEWVEKMADQLATLMRDASVNLYRWVLWRLIEASQHGRDYWQ